MRLLLAVPLCALALTACAPLDEPVVAHSTCHTSAGEFVNIQNGCTISYSVTRTTTTTTTTSGTPLTMPVEEAGGED